MARHGLRNSQIDQAFVEWLKQVQLTHPEIQLDDKLQSLLGFAFQAGADMQRHEVEAALQFSQAKESRR